MHKTLALVAVIVAAALAVGVVAEFAAQSAMAQTSTTTFPFTQTLSNVCSGFGACTNTATASVTAGGP